MGILSRLGSGVIVKQLTDKDEAESEGISELVYDLMKYQAKLVEPQFGTSYAKEVMDRTESCIDQLYDTIDLKGGVFGAYIDNRLVGYIYGYIHNTTEAYIAQVYVQDNYRGLKVGKALVDEFTKWGLENGASNIALDVIADNSKARSVYRKLGFRDCVVYMRKSK